MMNRTDDDLGTFERVATAVQLDRNRAAVEVGVYDVGHVVLAQPAIGFDYVMSADAVDELIGRLTEARQLAAALTRAEEPAGFRQNETDLL